MDPVLIYPIVLFVIFIYIERTVQLPESIPTLIYILIAVYYTKIKPIYGLIATVIFVLYMSNSAKKNQPEGFSINEKERGKNTIPKVIYQTWPTKNLPPKMADCVENLKRSNPGFEYHLYDDADCRAFIKEYFDPDVADAYDALLPGAFKADLWRYCVLYIWGGFYVDIKFICEPGFSFENISEPRFYVREYNHKGTGLYDHIVYTGVIGSTAKNPLFYKCIRQIVENVKNRFYGPEHTSPTGPWLFASKMDPDEIENIEYAYYETDGVGHIREINGKNTVIMSHYPEYRAEQKTHSKSSYWKDAWINREIYKE
jgi:hypothetical protein